MVSLATISSAALGFAVVIFFFPFSSVGVKVAGAVGSRHNRPHEDELG